jgi:asparagine N-glycosylation enzyme membrane subunit Stt3
MIPSSYHQQWQKAMQWVRENTPQGSIFVHWWDYGYWVQTLGERPTVVDGGHPIGFWDHLVGRYILTAPAPEITLSMMKTENASYLLIDSSDIGKYTAFSKIGSDKNGEDRYSQIPTFTVDPAQTKETSNKTIKVYTGGGIVDEDIIYIPEGDSSNEIFIPKENAYVIFMVIELTKRGNETGIEQPKAIFIYNNQQIQIPVRYLYTQGRLIDYKKGINATISLVPKISSGSNNQAQLDETGAAIYLSPKVSKGTLGQLYLLNSKEGRYSEFELVHSEQDQYVAYLMSVGIDLGEFVYLSGELRGPIKIWKANPDEDILTNEEFLRTSGEYAEFDNLTFVRTK